MSTQPYFLYYFHPLGHTWRMSRWQLSILILLLVIALTPSSSGALAASTIPEGALGTLIINIRSNKCLDVANGSTADGANVQQFACHWGPNQRWDLTNPTVGAYTAIKIKGTNKCLDVVNESTADGANVQQYACHSGNNQQWLIRADSAGGYRLINRASGKCLEVANGSLSDGANVQQSTCRYVLFYYVAGANQRWKFYPLDV
jgi:ricin-type beta-trefoil lectin protein